MYNYKIHLIYDGTNYLGFATQKHQNTIQDNFEKQLFRIFQEKIRIIGSGRTDRGVHAYDQVISFKSEKMIALNNVKMALNSYLPRDIRVANLEFVDLNFHARFSAKTKTYEYVINNSHYDLFNRHYELYVRHKMNFDTLSNAAAKFVGKHNFAAFTTMTYENPIREIYEIKVKQEKHRIIIRVTANGFLRYMVRMIVAKLISISIGNEDDINELFDKPEKGASASKVEGCGLYLKKIHY